MLALEYFSSCFCPFSRSPCWLQLASLSPPFSSLLFSPFCRWLPKKKEGEGEREQEEEEGRREQDFGQPQRGRPRRVAPPRPPLRSLLTPMSSPAQQQQHLEHQHYHRHHDSPPPQLPLQFAPDEVLLHSAAAAAAAAAPTSFAGIFHRQVT